MKEKITVIAGLGNPGPKYAMSRHNMGFGTIEYLSEKYGIKIKKIGCKGLYGQGGIENKPVVLLKPMTYMNESGVSVAEILSRYNVTPDNLIVLYDDLDMDPGMVRVRPKGSAGSHNGMKSIIYHLNTDQFIRIRIGIGRPKPDYDIIDYVLQRIPKEELPELKKGMETAGEAVVCILSSGISDAMNRYNMKKKD